MPPLSEENIAGSRGISGLIEISVSASTAVNEALLAFGGFPFPMEPAFVPGHLLVESRLLGVDNIEFDLEYQNPANPPFWVVNCTYLGGDDTDAGSFDIASSGVCANPGNMGRYDFAVGVTGVKSGTWKFDYFLSNDGGLSAVCPGIGAILVTQTLLVTLTATP